MARSVRSSITTENPRRAQSQATPAPVAPPPMTSTSAVMSMIGDPSRFSLDPVERPRDCLLPGFVRLIARARVHLGLPALVLDPVLAQVVDRRPEADGQPAGV